jgi:hypothetical protein
MAAYAKPQMVGYLLEYLVAFALVAHLNNGNQEALQQISVSISTFAEYVGSPESPYAVLFPDSFCGPDIVYKHGCFLYLVQVKFVDRISKQERVKACETTDPQFFYCNRTSNQVLRGFEGRRKDIDNCLQRNPKLQLKRLVFLHSTTATTVGMESVQVINERTCPSFFESLDGNQDMKIWKFLNEMRSNFNNNV